MKKIIFIIIIILLTACGASKETVIKPRTVTVETGKIETVIKTVPNQNIEKNMQLKTLDYIYSELDDSLKYSGEREVEIKGYKTKIRSSFHPKSKEIKVEIEKIKLDTVIADTVSIIKEEKKDIKSDIIKIIIITIILLLVMWRIIK